MGETHITNYTDTYLLVVHGVHFALCAIDSAVSLDVDYNPAPLPFYIFTFLHFSLI